MMWAFAMLAVLVMAGVAMVAAGHGQPMAQVYDDRPDALVPIRRDLEPGDLRRVRFSLAFRGYRMSEVDALLDRVARQLDERCEDRPDGPVGLAPTVTDDSPDPPSDEPDGFGRPLRA